MTIWSTELDRVLARGTFNRGERDTDVRVEHCEFELEVFKSRVGLPSAFVRVEFRDVRRVYLFCV